MVKISELTDIVRMATPVLYRTTYTATAVLLHDSIPREAKRIEFCVERTAVGPHHIRARFLDDIDYPLVPAISALNAHISKLHEDGELP